MKKYIAVYEDGTQVTNWNIDLDAAKFRFKDGVRLHGKLMSVKPFKTK